MSPPLTLAVDEFQPFRVYRLNVGQCFAGVDGARPQLERARFGVCERWTRCLQPQSESCVRRASFLSFPLVDVIAGNPAPRRLDYIPPGWSWRHSETVRRIGKSSALACSGTGTCADVSTQRDSGVD